MWATRQVVPWPLLLPKDLLLLGTCWLASDPLYMTLKSWSIRCLVKGKRKAAYTIFLIPYKEKLECRDALPRTVACCTFGSPKVGEQEFVNAFNTCVHKSWRVTVDGDTRVNGLTTPKPTFCHVGGHMQIATFEDGGKVTLPEESSEVVHTIQWSRMHGVFSTEV